MKKIVKYCGLAALLAGAAFCLPNCDDPDGPTGPEPYDGPWKVVGCPEGPSYLKGVFFLNADLGYAVGCRHILKYDGNKWNVDFAYKENSERYSVALEDVWFNAPDDGWVAGREYDMETKVSTALLLRYDGKEWKRFNHGTPATSFDALHFLSAGEGWAAGFGICHWNGGAWEYVSDLSYLTDIYANSPTDVWAVSRYSERIYHYDGATWTRVHEGSYPSVKLYAIGFSSPNRGWAGGDGCISGTQSNLLEYRNGEWVYHLDVPGGEGIRTNIDDIHFSSADCGWAVGYSTFFWDGTKWREVERPPDGYANAVFTLSEEDAWAVGDGRYRIMHYEP